MFTSTDEWETTRKKEIRNLFRFAGSMQRQLSGALCGPYTVRCPYYENKKTGQFVIPLETTPRQVHLLFEVFFFKHFYV